MKKRGLFCKGSAAPLYPCLGSLFRRQISTHALNDSSRRSWRSVTSSARSVVLHHVSFASFVLLSYNWQCSHALNDSSRRSWRGMISSVESVVLHHEPLSSCYRAADNALMPLLTPHAGHEEAWPHPQRECCSIICFCSLTFSATVKHTCPQWLLMQVMKKRGLIREGSAVLLYAFVASLFRWQISTHALNDSSCRSWKSVTSSARTWWRV